MATYNVTVEGIDHQPIAKTTLTVADAADIMAALATALSGQLIMPAQRRKFVITVEHRNSTLDPAKPTVPAGMVPNLLLWPPEPV